MPTILPTSTIGRVLASLWFAACLWVLFFGYQQQDIHDMPVAFVWFMIFLTFPVGLAVSMFVGVTLSAITTHYGLGYHPFWDLVPFWVISVIVGYAQFFILLPKLIRKGRHAKSST